MIEIIKRHMVGGQQHEHIAEVQYRLDGGSEPKKASRELMVQIVSNKSNEVVVYTPDRKSKARVEVVRPEKRDPYIRTYADGKWTDNLLSLDAY